MDLGYCEGDTCRRDGCEGTIETHPAKNCSCHISPPCSACTSPRSFCPECGWEEADEPLPPVETTIVPYPFYDTRPYHERLAALVPDKIRWLHQAHSHCSMIKEGVYPEGATCAEVREQVKGTFGGRFEYFGNGKFKYIAYTD